MTGGEDKRPRKKNFTHEEILILISFMKDNNKLLESKLNNTVTIRNKNDKWQLVTDMINSKGVEHREVKEVKKKWSDLRTQAIEDYPRTKNFPTGGGKKADIGPYSNLVLDVIGEDSPAVVGVGGGAGGIESGLSCQQVTQPISRPETALSATQNTQTPRSPEPPVDQLNVEAAVEAAVEAGQTHPPQEGASTPAHATPRPLQRVGKRSSSFSKEDDIDALRAKVFKAELIKIEEETKKIIAEKEKIDLEKVKINLEIIKLQEHLKPLGYSFSVTDI